MNPVLKHLEYKTVEARERFEVLQRTSTPELQEGAYRDFLIADAMARGAFAVLHPQRSGLDLPLPDLVRGRTCVTIKVEVRLDPVAGWGDNAEDFRRHVEDHLQQSIPHYLESVTVAEVSA